MTDSTCSQALPRKPKRKRAGMSKRTRFDIFKRDDFTCQYCGRKPPTVLLQVDHIIPVSHQGKTEPENLITSCAECNIGKSANPLEQKLSPIMVSAEKEKEKFDQIKEYQAFLTEKAEVMNAWFKGISDEWMRQTGQDPNQWQVGSEKENAIRRFLKRIPAEEIMDAVRITLDRMRGQKDYQQFRYFCAVCWRKVSAFEGPQQEASK